jgi:CBS domain-containing protein
LTNGLCRHKREGGLARTMRAAAQTAAINLTPPGPSHLAPSTNPQWVTATPKAKGDVIELFGSLVRDIMTRKVVTVQSTDSLRFAATLLSKKAFSGVPVVGGEGKVVGVLSEKDLLRVLNEKAGLAVPGGLFDLFLETSEARQKDLLARCRRVLDEVLVSAAMTSPARTISPDAPSLEAVRQMVVSRINRLPVVEHGKLVGIVTRGDVLRLGQGAF